MASTTDTNKAIPISYNFNKTIASLGPHAFTYGWFGSRKLTQVGKCKIEYGDMFQKDRITRIGHVVFVYGLQGRLNKVGNWTYQYGMKGRLNAIGPFKLTYATLSGKLQQVGDYSLEYGFWGRLNGIHLLGDALTDERTLLILLVLFYLQGIQDERDAQALRDKHAKLVREGKMEVKT